jgi:hypothetical protein
MHLDCEVIVSCLVLQATSFVDIAARIDGLDDRLCQHQESVDARLSELGTTLHLLLTRIKERETQSGSGSNSNSG